MPVRYIGLAEEVTFGDEIAATKYVAVKDADIKGTQEFGDQEDVADDEGIRKSDIQFASEEGGWNMYVEPENGITRLLKLLFGAGTSTIVGVTPAYDHEFGALATRPSGTVRKGLDDAELIATGQMIESLEFSFEARQYLMCRAELLGKFEDAVLGSIGTPTFSAKKAFIAKVGVFQIDAAAKDIQSATIKISNQFETDDAVIGDLSYKRALIPNRLLVEGTIDWQDFATVERTKFINGTVGTLLLQGVGADINGGPETDEFEIKLDEVQYRDLEWPMSGKDVRRMSTGYKALIDPTSGFSVEVRVRNEETSIV